LRKALGHPEWMSKNPYKNSPKQKKPDSELINLLPNPLAILSSKKFSSISIETRFLPNSEKDFRQLIFFSFILDPKTTVKWRYFQSVRVLIIRNKKIPFHELEFVKKHLCFLNSIPFQAQAFCLNTETNM